MDEDRDASSSSDLYSCARCRAKCCCSCRQLGLDDHYSSSTCEQNFLVENRTTKNGHAKCCCSSLSVNYEGSTRQNCQCCGDRDVLRRRPPEDSLLPTCTRNNVNTRRKSSSPPYLAATLLILSTGLIGMAEACSSRSTPKPRPPTPTPRPNITFHMYTCPPDYAEWYCLNGATCFTVKIVDSLLYNCLCANGYIGQRCEFKDLDGSYLPSRQRIMLETASIAGAVTIAVFLAVITFISVYIHCKRKQKELRTSSGVDAVDGPGRDPELRPFCSRSRSLMIFMAKNPNSSTTAPSIEQTRMPNWNYPPESSTRMASVNENKRQSQ